MPFEITVSPHFLTWLHDARISLAFSTYQTNRLFLVGLKPDGSLSTFERLFDRPMGLCAHDDGLLMATRWQIWDLRNALPPGAEHDGYDRLYVPRTAHTTGEVDAHDIAVDAAGRITFVNTLYSCLATVSREASFAPVWKPPFISELAAEDRCHLNGLAMQDGAPRYVTAVSRSDIAAGWRDRRGDGGVLFDVTTDRPVLTGLSMPHSPRLHQGRLWLQNAGTGELGFADLAAGTFMPVAFCPGFMRGLAFAGDFAVVGLSKPRRQRAFDGLALDARLRAKDAEAMCGLWVIDTRTGKLAHWLKLEETVVELYDVQVLPGARRPMALGFQSDEIRRLISIRLPDRVAFDPLGSDILATDGGTTADMTGQLSLPARPPAAAPQRPADYQRANQLARVGRYAEAAEAYQRVLAEQPGFVNAWLNLGSCRWQLGQADEAITCYRAALTIDPNSALALTNLAKALRTQGRVSEALTHYLAALKLKPEDVSLLNELGLTFYEDGRLDRAGAMFQRAIELDPNNAEAHNNLAGVHKLNQNLDDALKLHKRAVEIQPDFFVALENIGKIHEDRHETAEARTAYRRALRAKADPLLELHAELLCPPVFPDAAALDDYRARAEAALDARMGQIIAVAPERAQSSRGEPPFDWAYHGRNNRALKKKYARMFVLADPTGGPPAIGRRPAGAIHVCFVVTPSHEGVFMRCMRGIINQLDPARFQVTLACSRAAEDVLRRGVTRADARYLRMPLRFDQMAAQLRAARPDVLYYWEVGTDSSNFFLPFLRLAPVQCTGWGWPDTSGAPELDYHLSSDALTEPGDETQFTEVLARLPHLPAYFYRSPIPDTLRRNWLVGLAAQSGAHRSDGATLYVCPQNLRKAHPDIDAMVGGVLRGDPNGLALFVDDPQPAMGRLLRERWKRALPDVESRIILLPRLSPDDYFAAVGAADVVLDTPHFGGSNTSYDALSAGTPVVTLPGAFPRGRYTAALYRTLGVSDGIADSPEDYVEIALALGTDPAYRDELRRAILERAGAIFERPESVTQLETFFEHAVART